MCRSDTFSKCLVNYFMFMKRYEKILVVVADFLIQMSNSFSKFGNVECEILNEPMV
jgi:hypothetical protein